MNKNKLQTQDIIEILELFRNNETHTLCNNLILKYIHMYGTLKINDSYFIYQNNGYLIIYNITYIPSIQFNFDTYFSSHYLINSRYTDATKGRNIDIDKFLLWLKNQN